MGLAKLALEFFPGHHIPIFLHGTGAIPPSSCGSRKVVGGVKNLLIFANSGDFQIVFHSAKPIIGIQRFFSLGESWRVGVLETSQLGAGFPISITISIVISSSMAIPIGIVVHGHLGELLKSGQVGLVFSSGCLPIFHDHP
jgi:hypothetical protein